jgi:hypothetical protein
MRYDPAPFVGAGFVFREEGPFSKARFQEHECHCSLKRTLDSPTSCLISQSSNRHRVILLVGCNVLFARATISMLGWR